MTTTKDDFNRSDQTPLQSPWTNVAGGNLFNALPMCLHNDGFSDPPNTAFGRSPNGGENGGVSVRLGDGAYQPDQTAQAVIKSIAPNNCTMHLTAASVSGNNVTYTYSNCVVDPNGDASGGIFTNLQVIISGMQNSANNGNVVVTAHTGGPTSGTFTINRAGGVNESGSSGTGIGISNSLCGLAVRMMPDGRNGYYTLVGTNDGYIGGAGPNGDARVYAIEMWFFSDGVNHGVGGGSVITSVPDSAGDLYSLSAIGSTITLAKNGVALITHTDTFNQVGGYPGVSGQSLSSNSPNFPGNNGTVWTDWQGSDNLGTVTGGWKTVAGDWFSGGDTGFVNIGSYWTPLTGVYNTYPLVYLGQGTSIGVSPGGASARYTGRSWANDQASEITVGDITVASPNTFYLFVRSDAIGWSTGGNSYIAEAVVYNGSSNRFLIGKWVNGTFTTLGTLSTGATNAVAPGDSLRLEVKGQNLILYKNDVIQLMATDSSVASGNPGFLVQASTFVSNWTGDEYITPGAPPPLNRLYSLNFATQSDANPIPPPWGVAGTDPQMKIASHLGTAQSNGVEAASLLATHFPAKQFASFKGILGANSGIGAGVTISILNDAGFNYGYFLSIGTNGDGISYNLTLGAYSPTNPSGVYLYENLYWTGWQDNVTSLVVAYDGTSVYVFTSNDSTVLFSATDSLVSAGGGLQTSLAFDADNLTGLGVTYFSAGEVALPHGEGGAPGGAVSAGVMSLVGAIAGARR